MLNIFHNVIVTACAVKYNALLIIREQASKGKLLYYSTHLPYEIRTLSPVVMLLARLTC